MIKRAILSVSDKTGIVDLARRLAAKGVTLLSTGGTQKAIADAGIKLYGGVSGNADAAAQALVEGKLEFNPNVRCNHHGEHHHHHDEGHTCGDHGCGSHSCGHH